MTDKTQAGEAIIRYWFRRSLAIILVTGTIAAGIGWYLNRDEAPAVIIEEATVSGPVIEEKILPQSPPAVAFRDVTLSLIHI